MKITRNTLYKLLILSSVLISPPLLNGQYSLELSTAVGGSNDDEARAVAFDGDGGYYVAARSFSSDGDVPENKGNSDYWIVRFNAENEIVSSWTYGGFNGDDAADITLTDDGNLAVFGTTRSNDGDVINNPAIIGAWLLVLDDLGEIAFSRVYAGQLGEQGIDIHANPDGFTLLVQSSSPELEGAENNGNFDYWIARTNAIGSIEWAEFYGGEDADIPTAMVQVPGGYVMAGYSNSIDGDVLGNKGGFDYWIVKVNFEGELEWAKTYGGSGDDMAHDIAWLDDGSLLVIGESDSDDGDKSEVVGETDVWLIKLDAEGELLWERTYGGSDDDIGRQLGLLSDGTIVFSADSESTDGDLNANKGLIDTWVAYADSDGNIFQQMNYGGSRFDFIHDIGVENDVVLLCGNTDSRDGNLSFADPDEENAWLLRMLQDTVPCAANDECFIQDVAAGILNVTTNGGQRCTNSCNVGASDGPFGPGCFNFNNKRTAWFKIRTDSAARQMSINVVSDEFNRPQFGVYQSTDCQTFLRLQCTVGENGFAQIVNLEVDPDTAYYVSVTDADGLAGTFSICARVLDIEFCNKAPLLYATSTSLGSPLNGPYLPGEDVQFCYEINNWDKLDCNGLQGIQPEFGPGWAPSNFNIFGEPVRVDTMLMPTAANGSWDWYPLGGVTYNFTNPSQGYSGGQGLPGGWYFTNFDSPPPNDDPDQTTGDITTCLEDTTSTWKVCFTLTTVSACDTDLDCNVTIKSFADGEIGSDISQTCQYDDPLVFPATLKCCIAPFIDPVATRTLCSSDTLIVNLSSNLPEPVQYVYEVETFGSVVGAESGSGSVINQQLFNFGNDLAMARYSVVATSQNGCVTDPMEFDVLIRRIPRAQMSRVGSGPVCEGGEVMLRFEFDGTPPHRAAFRINGEVQPEFVSQENVGMAAIELEETAFFSFVEYRDASCVGSPSGSFTVDVVNSSIADSVAMLCPNESVIIDGNAYSLPGDYQVTIEGGAASGCDSIVNLVIIGLPDFETDLELSICEGDSVVVGESVYKTSGIFTDSLQSRFGCDSVVNLALTVTRQIFSNENIVACFGDVIEWRGNQLIQGGVYRDTVPQSAICDSIYTLTLTYLNNIVLTETNIIPDTGQSSGSISIELTGGAPPYQFLWSNGDTTQNLENVPSGDYSVSVTDINNCFAEFDFFIATATANPIPGISSVEIFPNPVSVSGNIIARIENEGSDLDRLDMSLVDIAGRVVWKRGGQNIHQGQNTILIKDAVHIPGVHFLVLSDTASGKRSVIPVAVQ